MPLRSRWSTIAAWFVGSRLVIAALGTTGVATFATLAPDGSGAGMVQHSRAALNPENVWQKWDAVWYERLATHGYAYQLDTPRGQAAAAFFPLYPMTVRAVWPLMPSLSFFWVGSLLSNLFTIAALWLLARSLIDPDTTAGRVLAVMLTSAGSFYLSIPYGEGLFLLLVVGALIATRQRRYEIAGLLAGLAATTRAHGLALVAVPAVAAWLDASLAPRTRVARALATLAVFALPVIGYLLFLANVHGSWDAMFARQAFWDNPTPYPLQALVGQFAAPTRISGWLHGAYWVMAAALVWRYRRRLPLGEVLFCVGALLISTQQDTFHGIYRYVTPLVPLMVAVSADDDRTRFAFIGINLAFGVLMILAFVTNNRLAV
jgi:Gpi18-like mannosyltransferase